jgi:hypothetical protein
MYLAELRRLGKLGLFWRLGMTFGGWEYLVVEAYDGPIPQHSLYTEFPLYTLSLSSMSLVQVNSGTYLREMQAREIQACETQVCEMHVCETRACEMRACICCAQQTGMHIRCGSTAYYLAVLPG